MDLVIAFLRTSHDHDTIFTVVNWFSKLVTFVPCVISSTAGDIM